MLRRFAMVFLGLTCIGVMSAFVLAAEDERDVGKPSFSDIGRYVNPDVEMTHSEIQKEIERAKVHLADNRPLEAKVVIEQWRRRYNDHRPHSSQNYITPEMAYFGLRELSKA